MIKESISYTEQATVMMDTGDITLVVMLTYHSDDPFAVYLVFQESRPVTWRFARDLLADGTYAVAGIGNVQIWQEGAFHVIIRINSPDGTAHVRLRLRQLKSFLEATKSCVPLGAETERLDFSQELAELLSS